MKRLILITASFIMMSGGSLFSQDKWGIGASLLWNTRNNYLGASARVLIPVKDKFWAVPYGYYYFSSGELNGGISAMVPFYSYKSFTFYAIASGTFRGHVSVSVNDSTASSKKSYKADGEIGAGVMIGPRCLKGFVEPRYAILNEEVLVRIGAIYFFGCKRKKARSKGGGGGGWKSSKKKSLCPAYEW